MILSYTELLEIWSIMYMVSILNICTYITLSINDNRRVSYYMQKKISWRLHIIIYFIDNIKMKTRKKNTLKWKEFHFCFSFLHTLWNIFSDFGHILEPFHALLHQISKLYALCNPPRRLLIRKVIPILFDALTNDYFLASKCYQIGSFQHPSFV